MKIACLGSTGLVGSLLVQEALKDESLEKLCVVGRRSGDWDSHQRISECILPEMTPAKIEALHLDADFFVSCLGTTMKKAGSKEAFRAVDFDLNLAFAKLAKAHKAKAFVLVSAVGANPESLFFYNRVKGELEAAVKQLELVSLTILRPALLIGERREARFAEGLGIKLFRGLEAVFSQSTLSKLGTRSEIVAQAAMKALKDRKAGSATVEDFIAFCGE